MWWIYFKRAYFLSTRHGNTFACVRAKNKQQLYIFFLLFLFFFILLVSELLLSFSISCLNVPVSTIQSYNSHTHSARVEGVYQLKWVSCIACAIVCAFQFWILHKKEKKTLKNTNTKKNHTHNVLNQFDTRNEVEHFLVELKFIIIIFCCILDCTLLWSANFGRMCKIRWFLFFFYVQTCCDHRFISI